MPNTGLSKKIAKRRLAICLALFYAIWTSLAFCTVVERSTDSGQIEQPSSVAVSIHNDAAQSDVAQSVSASVNGHCGENTSADNANPGVSNHDCCDDPVSLCEQAGEGYVSLYLDSVMAASMSSHCDSYALDALHNLTTYLQPQISSSPVPIHIIYCIYRL